MADKKDGCVTPVKGVITAASETPSENPIVEKEVSMVLAKVGKPAPDFELTAFHNGGFKNVKLSDSKGKWIVICF